MLGRFVFKLQQAFVLNINNYATNLNSKIFLLESLKTLPSEPF